MRRFYAYAAWAWTLIILILYGIPGHMVRYNEPFDLIRLDKLVHFSIFALQSILFGLWLRTGERKLWTPFVLMFPIFYGGCLEYFQSSWFIERTTDLADFIANVCGASCGYLIISLFIRKTKSQVKKDIASSAD